MGPPSPERQAAKSSTARAPVIRVAEGASVGGARRGGRIRVVYAYAGFYRNAGGEARPLELARRLDPRRFELHVAVMEPTRSPRGRALRETGVPLHQVARSRRLRDPRAVPRLLRAFRELFESLRPDVVSTQGFHANVLARHAALAAGVPAVVATENWFRGTGESALRRLVNAPLYAWSDRLDPRTHAFAATSRAVAEEVRRRSPGGPVEVIYPPFDAEAARAGRPEDSRRRPFAAPERPRIGVVARLGAEKGHRFLLDAMPRILRARPRTELAVVGAGPEERRLRRRVRALGVGHAVDFRGFRPDVRAELERLDALFLPSLREPLGLVVLEGLATGLPVVVTRSGGVPEVVTEGETGLLVEPASPAALAEAFERLVADPAGAAAMGARAAARGFEPARPAEVVARYERLYERVLEREPPRPASRGKGGAELPGS